MAEDVDVGELIREISKEERKIVNSFEKAEMDAEKIRSNIENEVLEVLRKEKEKALAEKVEFLKAERGKAEAQRKKTLELNKKDVQSAVRKIREGQATIVEEALKQLVEEVRNAV